MDEKELLKKIKRSFKAKKTRAQITSSLQKRGYKLAYIDELIKKSQIPKKIIFSVLILVCILSLILSLNFKNFKEMGSKNEITKERVTFPKSQTYTPSALSQNKLQESYTEITINEEFITNFLKDLNVDVLHKNFLTGEDAIINFQIDDQNFYSMINKRINTQKGISNKADIQISTTNEILQKALSSDISQTFKESLNQGTTNIEVFAGEAELFSKGYLSFYNSLK